jgi:hypothetical protein
LLGQCFHDVFTSDAAARKLYNYLAVRDLREKYGESIFIQARKPPTEATASLLRANIPPLHLFLSACINHHRLDEEDSDSDDPPPPPPPPMPGKEERYISATAFFEDFRSFLVHAHINNPSSSSSSAGAGTSSNIVAFGRSLADEFGVGDTPPKFGIRRYGKAGGRHYAFTNYQAVRDRLDTLGGYDPEICLLSPLQFTIPS